MRTDRRRFHALCFRNGESWIGCSAFHDTFYKEEMSRLPSKNSGNLFSIAEFYIGKRWRWDLHYRQVLGCAAWPGISWEYFGDRINMEASIEGYRLQVTIKIHTLTKCRETWLLRFLGLSLLSDSVTAIIFPGAAKTLHICTGTGRRCYWTGLLLWPFRYRWVRKKKRCYHAGYASCYFHISTSSMGIPVVKCR